MLPTTHHITRPQSTPSKGRRSKGTKPSRRHTRGCQSFTIDDALFQVAIGELKSPEAIRLVISLAANGSLNETSSEALGAIAGKAGCGKAENPYDHKSHRKLFAAFEKGLKVGQAAAKSVRVTRSQRAKSTRKKSLH